MGDNGSGHLWPTPFTPVKVNLVTPAGKLLLLRPDGDLNPGLGMDGKLGKLVAKVTPKGVEAPATTPLEGWGKVTASVGATGETPGLIFTPSHGKPVPLSAPFGAGLFGMALP